MPLRMSIHNAGAIRAALLSNVTTSDLLALTQLHLNTALILVQAALPSMRAAGFGRIVLISSRAALGLRDPHRLFRHQSRHDRHGPHLGAGTRA